MSAPIPFDQESWQLSDKFSKSCLPVKYGAGVVLVAEDTGAILTLRYAHHKGGTWCIPGGKCDPGESPLDGGLRELHEETGFANISDVRPVHRYDIRHADEWSRSNRVFSYHTFVATTPEQKPPAIQAREHMDFRWIEKLEDWPDLVHEAVCVLLTNTQTRDLIERVQAQFYVKNPLHKSAELVHDQVAINNQLMRFKNGR